MEKEESANIYIDDEDLFRVSSSTNCNQSMLSMTDNWGDMGLSQWFDGAIDVDGTPGLGLDLNLAAEDEDDRDMAYSDCLWSGIDEPNVLSEGRTRVDHDLAVYTAELDVPEADDSISAADMLQLPIIHGPYHAREADSLNKYTAWSEMPSDAALESVSSMHHSSNSDDSTQPIQALEDLFDAEEDHQLEIMGSDTYSIELALDILSDGVMSVSLGEESDDDSQQELVAYQRSSSNSRHEFEYELMQSPIRRGTGFTARKKMMHEWLNQGESTFIVPDNMKGADPMETIIVGSGPRDILQPREMSPQPADSRWAEQLLNLCAGAIASKNIGRTQHLMWVLNELASFTGDGNQRLAAYGLKALFCRITGGKEAAATYIRPFHHQEKTLGPKAVHRALVTFHEFNAWHQVAYTVTNETLLEAFAGKSHLHIVDVGIIKGLQWPILIDALSNRPGGPPTKLRITTIRHQNASAKTTGSNQVDAESADFMNRLVTFAKVLGLHCELNMYVGPLENIKKEDLKLEDGEVLAVCCQFRLHRLSNLVPRSSRNNPAPPLSPRDAFLDFLSSLKPSVLVVSENNVDMLSDDFLTRFKEIVNFWWTFFDSTHVSFNGREPEAQQIVEYEGSMIMLNGIACEGDERIERNDIRENWMSRIRRAGFVPMCISDDSKKTAQVLLQNIASEHWSISHDQNTNCLNMSWKDQPVNFTSVWKAPSCSRKLCKCNMLHD